MNVLVRYPLYANEEKQAATEETTESAKVDYRLKLALTAVLSLNLAFVFGAITLVAFLVKE